MEILGAKVYSCCIEICVVKNSIIKALQCIPVMCHKAIHPSLLHRKSRLGSCHSCGNTTVNKFGDSTSKVEKDRDMTGLHIFML